MKAPSTPHLLKRQVGHYKIISQIGKGGFSKVMLAVDLYTREKVAIKVIDKKRLTEAELKRTLRQIQIQSKLEHPGILQLLEVIEDLDLLYIVLEYCEGGDLFEVIRRAKSLTEDRIKNIFWQVLEAVCCFHAQDVGHRDLKPENILIGKNRDIKIGDFGLATKHSPHVYSNTKCGSSSYIAPEVANSEPYSPTSADVWSLGITLYVCLTSSMPCDTPGESLEQDEQNRFIIPPSDEISSSGMDLLERMLTRAEQRITIKQVMAHPFFEKQAQKARSEMFDKWKISTELVDQEIAKETADILQISKQTVLKNIIGQTLNEVYAVYKILGIRKRDKEIAANKVVKEHRKLTSQAKSSKKIRIKHSLKTSESKLICQDLEVRYPKSLESYRKERGLSRLNKSQFRGKAPFLNIRAIPLIANTPLPGINKREEAKSQLQSFRNRFIRKKLMNLDEY